MATPPRTMGEPPFVDKVVDVFGTRHDLSVVSSSPDETVLAFCPRNRRQPFISASSLAARAGAGRSLVSPAPCQRFRHRRSYECDGRVKHEGFGHSAFAPGSRSCQGRERQPDLLPHPLVLLHLCPAPQHPHRPRRPDPPQRPRRVPAHQWLGVRERVREHGRRLRRAPVAERHRHVAQRPPAPGPLRRRALEAPRDQGRPEYHVVLRAAASDRRIYRRPPAGWMRSPAVTRVPPRSSRSNSAKSADIGAEPT